MECVISLAAFADRISGFSLVKSAVICEIIWLHLLYCFVLKGKIAVWIDLNSGILILLEAL